MATLPATTVGNAAAPNGWPSAPNGALGDNSDATYGYVDTNTTGDYDQGWAMGDTPADFGTMDTLAVVLRYAWSATPTNTTWPTLAARIMSGATVLAANTSAGAFETVASSITTTTPTNSGSIPFTYVNTAANKATWDAAVVEVRIARSRSKAGGSEQQRVFEADLSGTYTVGAEEHSGTAIVTGGGVVTLAQSTARSAAPILTGGGIATVAQSSVRSAAVVITGGGVATPASRKGGQAAPVLTGGGVVTIAQSTARSGAWALTGGGAVTVVGAAYVGGAALPSRYGRWWSPGGGVGRHGPGILRQEDEEDEEEAILRALLERSGWWIDIDG